VNHFASDLDIWGLETVDSANELKSWYFYQARRYGNFVQISGSDLTH
jgi:hypothetical protein